MGVLKSLLTSTRSKAIAGCSADDIERATAVYLQRVVALQTGLAESNHRLASELKTLTEEKKKEAHHYKKKISSLKKSLETLDARAHEQETENNNLRSILAHAPEEAIERSKASAEYARDLEVSVEQYKTSSDYAKALNSYGGKAMTASIKLSKEWIMVKHPSIDPSGLDRFLVQRDGKESGA
ncbi:uncharacterized protein LOC111379501 [Olea europaea var. sylvestris]|uniref:uncharacterized protein LOC111379501 n=1 Tax=Olea europaea var. sylvestris TaxID=158386 RepID=UPI000C1D3730|nr:uncharacterized protein LOC111379501 [Olea europaea var. sylvestris]XP_022858650.1 uncharacterized protein LOC111379501 [Olea europaea var. sylvestris]XP_022858651.1 uncharacterized protein LOC111379501 [Olea europaea var. sylvestris]